MTWENIHDLLLSGKKQVIHLTRAKGHIQLHNKWEEETRSSNSKTCLSVTFKPLYKVRDPK